MIKFIDYIIATILLCRILELHAAQATKEKSPAMNFTIGALSGCAGVAASEPLVYIKNMVQQNKNCSFKPTTMYRGILVNGSGFIPIMALQNATNKLVLNQLDHINSHKAYNKPIAAFSAGAVSALVATPRDLIVLLQQNKFAADTMAVNLGGLTKDQFLHNHSNGDYSFYSVTKEFYNQHGPAKAFRGFLPAVLKTGGYATGLFVLLPHFKSKFSHYNLHPALKVLLPGLCAGTIAALATQPADVIKTHMQTNIDGGGTLNTARTLYSQTKNSSVCKNFLKTFYKGTIPRVVGVGASMTAVHAAQNYLNQKFV